jgi:ectoine hydroxylase-related dioxygenase (phytanoyl-CoA dioxygenase family)
VGDLFTVHPQFATQPARPAPMRAGDASVHNGLTIHGAGANMTPGWRRAMTCAYMPIGSRFNGQRNVLPEAYYQSLRIGDLLDRDDQNPWVHGQPRPLGNSP